jgi:predicted RND superfamily exporter protein
VALLTLFFVGGIPRLERETTVRTFLGADHPAIQALDRHIETFGGGYPVIVAYSCDETPLCDTVFDDSALGMAEAVVRQLERSFGVRGVFAPSNAVLLVPAGDELRVRQLVDDYGRIAPDRDELAAIAMGDPLWARTVLSSDGRVGAIVIDVASSAADVQDAVAAALERALDPLRREGWSFHLVGELVDFEYAGVEVERDSQAMLPVMIAVLCAVLLALLRSFALALAALAAMGVAFVWTQGAMGWAGVELDAVTTIAPSVVFAIGLLDSVHVIAHYSRRCWERGDVSRAERGALMLETTREIGGACLLTSLTTMGAFLAFAASGIATFTAFGLVAAWGILAALLLTFSALPVVLCHLPDSALGRQRAESAWRQMLDSTVAAIRRRRRGILFTTSALTVICLIGVARIRVQIDPQQLAGETNRVTKWSRWVAKNLRETESLEIVLMLPQGQSFQAPSVLDALDRISRWLDEDVERIGHARSILGPLRRLNQALHGGRPQFARYEPTPSGNAQLVALLSMNDPGALERWVYTDLGSGNGSGAPRRDMLRIAAEAESMPTPLQARLLAEVEAHLDETLPEGWGYSLTGSVPMYLEMMSALERNQLICFGIAGAVIFALMAAFMRSAALSLLALIPAIVPCVVTVGLLGLWGYGLDPASTMVATIILGVSVDDGIHMLARYRSTRLGGLGSQAAIEDAVRHVGKPVVVSSLVLAAAFWSLTLSRAASVATFGFLAGVAILAALLADLLLLPALLSTGRIAAWVPLPALRRDCR